MHKDLSKSLEDLTIESSDSFHKLSPVFLRKNGQLSATNNGCFSSIIDQFREICNSGDPYKRYDVYNELGCGASGVVFNALDVETGEKLAIKDIDLTKQSSHSLIVNEIRILKDFNHKNLVNFLDSYLGKFDLK